MFYFILLFLFLTLIYTAFIEFDSCVIVCVLFFVFIFFFFFQAEDGIRDLVRSRGLGDVYKRQISDTASLILSISSSEGSSPSILVIASLIIV